MDSNLYFEPIKQEAWHLQTKDTISTSKRPIDKMSIAEILKMYQDKKFLCDICKNELGKCDFSLEDHITHLINPIIIWSCDDCIIKDLKQGNVIGTTEKRSEQWQLNNM